MVRKLKQPMLRFTGFDEDWESVKLGDVLDYEQPTKYLVDSADYSDDFKTPVLTAGKSFLLGYTDELDGIYDKGPMILFDDFTTSFHYVDFPFKVKSSATKFLTEVDGNDLRFLHGALSGVQYPSDDHKRYWISEYTTLKVKAPKLPEQKLVGDFFQTLDSLVELEQEKLDNKKLYKEAMLQKMFPKKGEQLPEIRFNGYNDAWVETKLGEVLDKGNLDRVADTSEYQRITVKLNNNGLEEFIPTRQMADTRPFYQRFAGEIIIGKQNYFNGSIAIVSDEFDGFICSNAIMSFNVKDEHSLDFVFGLIGQRDYVRERAYLANGTGQKELSERDFLGFKVWLPSLPEQEQIGQFFKSLDDSIELQEQKVEQYKEVKESFLQKMFV